MNNPLFQLLGPKGEVESQAACLLLFISPFTLSAAHSSRVTVAVASGETLLHLILPPTPPLFFNTARRDSLGNVIWPVVALVVETDE